MNPNTGEPSDFGNGSVPDFSQPSETRPETNNSPEAIPDNCRSASLEVMKLQAAQDRARAEWSRCATLERTENNKRHLSSFDDTRYEQLKNETATALEKMQTTNLAAVAAYNSFREEFKDIPLEKLLTIAEPFARRSEGRPSDPRGPIPGIQVPIARLVDGTSIELYPIGQAQPGVRRALRGVGMVFVGNRTEGGSQEMESPYEGDDSTFRQKPTKNVSIYRVVVVTEVEPGSGKLQVELQDKLLNSEEAKAVVESLKSNLDLEMWQRAEQAQIEKTHAERRVARLKFMEQNEIKLPPLVEEWTHPDGRNMRGQAWQNLAWQDRTLQYDQGKITTQPSQYPYDRRYTEEVAKLNNDATIDWNVNDRMRKYFPDIQEIAIKTWAESGDYGIPKDLKPPIQPDIAISENL